LPQRKLSAVVKTNLMLNAALGRLKWWRKEFMEAQSAGNHAARMSASASSRKYEQLINEMTTG